MEFFDLFMVNVAYAAPSDAVQLVLKINKFVINPIIGLGIAAGFVVFFYGVLEYINKQRVGQDASDGKRHMLWGVFGLFIMLGVLGIMQLILVTIDADGIVDLDTNQVTLPN